MFAGSLYKLDISKVPLLPTSTTVYFKVNSLATLVLNEGVINYAFPSSSQVVFDLVNGHLVFEVNIPEIQVFYCNRNFISSTARAHH